jgi:hypothetical protein
LIDYTIYCGNRIWSESLDIQQRFKIIDGDVGEILKFEEKKLCPLKPENDPASLKLRRTGNS